MQLEAMLLIIANKDFFHLGIFFSLGFESLFAAFLCNFVS